MSVSASIGYHVTPEASTTVCDTPPKGDANACFEVYRTISGGISLGAYWKKRNIRCYWKWGPRCSVSMFNIYALKRWEQDTCQ